MRKRYLHLTWQCSFSSLSLALFVFTLRSNVSMLFFFLSHPLILIINLKNTNSFNVLKSTVKALILLAASKIPLKQTNKQMSKKT